MDGGVGQLSIAGRRGKKKRRGGGGGMIRNGAAGKYDVKWVGGTGRDDGRGDR